MLRSGVPIAEKRRADTNEYNYPLVRLCFTIFACWP